MVLMASARAAQGDFPLMRYLLAWLPMLLLAVANGALREWTFAKVLPELRAHQLSTLIGAVLMGVFIWFVVLIWPPASGQQALLVGTTWLVLTVAFEFWMGLVLMQRSLAQVLDPYNLLTGRVWVLFLIWIAIAPWLFLTLRNAA
jgi:hypothetical protein